MLADHIGIPHLRELAAKEESLKTAVSAFDMSRLTELLHPDADADKQRLTLDIGFQRSSGVDPGFPEISGVLHVALELTCQRCLGLLSWSDKLQLRLVVVESEADLDQLAEPYDSVVIGEQGISLLSIVEDEVLASLPLAPKHQDIADCAESGTAAVQENVVMETPEVHSKPNRPFADLAEMLKSTPIDDTD